MFHVFNYFVRFSKLLICYFSIIANNKILETFCKNPYNLPLLTAEPRNVTPPPVLQSHDDAKEADFSRPLAPTSKAMFAHDPVQDICPLDFPSFNTLVNFYYVAYAAIFLVVLLMILGRQICKRKAQIKEVRCLESGDSAPQNNICKQQTATTFSECKLQSIIDDLQRSITKKDKLIKKLSSALSKKERKQAMEGNWSDTDSHSSSYNEDKNMIRAEKPLGERATSQEDALFYSINQRLRKISVVMELMEDKIHEMDLKQEEIREKLSYINEKVDHQKKYVDVFENENKTFYDVLKQKQEQVEKVQKKCENFLEAMKQVKQLKTSLPEAAPDSAISAGDNAPI